MSAEQLNVASTDDPRSGFRIIRLSGPLVLRTVFAFQDRIRAENELDLALDLSEVEHMDSAGLGALLGGFASYQRRGKRFVLIGVRPRILALLEVTHTDQLLPRFDTVEAARESKPA